ncbi:MAG: hypothetical protein ABIP75_20035 [Pyrinomonadaceae bacterium]
MYKLQNVLASAFLVAAIAGSAASHPSIRLQTGSTVPADVQLSEAQRTALRKIDRENKLRLAGITVRIGIAAKALYDHLLSDNPNRQLDQKLTRNLHTVAGELLTARGEAFRKAIATLTPAQRRLVKKEMHRLDAPLDLLELIGKTFGLTE